LPPSDARRTRPWLIAFSRSSQNPAISTRSLIAPVGNRAAVTWLIKRVLIDKWDSDRALEEATQLGSISPVMKTFALDNIQAHKK